MAYLIGSGKYIPLGVYIIGKGCAEVTLTHPLDEILYN